MIFYVINNLSFLLLIVSVSLESGATFYASEGSIDSEKIALFCIAWSFIATLLCFGLLSWSGSLYGVPEIRGQEFVYACTAYILGILLTTYFNALFFAKRDFFLPNFILLTINLLLIAVLILAGERAFLHRHFVALYLISFLLQGCGLAIVYAVKYFNARSWGFPSSEQAKKLVQYSLVALAANIIFFLVYRVDYWFVKNFCSYTDLGNYIQVSKLGQLLVLVPSILATTLFPLVAGGNKEEVQKNLKVLTRLMLAGIGSICLFFTIFGKWLFPFIFGKSFTQMNVLFLLLIPGIMALSAHYPLTAYYSGKKMIPVNIKGSLLALFIIISADAIFIPLAGVKAASVTSSIGYIVYYLYILAVFKKEYHTSVYDFFLIKKSDFLWVKNIVSKIWSK